MPCKSETTPPNETADDLYAILAQFIRAKENPSHGWEWKAIDLLCVRSALKNMTEQQREKFYAEFKDYRVIKSLSASRIFS